MFINLILVKPMTKMIQEAQDWITLVAFQEGKGNRKNLLVN